MVKKRELKKMDERERLERRIKKAVEKEAEEKAKEKAEEKAKKAAERAAKKAAERQTRRRWNHHRTMLSYRLSEDARDKLENWIEEIPVEFAMTISDLQEAITMAYLKTEPTSEDALELIKKLRRGELKLNNE
jgi:hypothetical protein